MMMMKMRIQFGRRDESFEEFTADNNSLPWNDALLENLDDIEVTEANGVNCKGS